MDETVRWQVEQVRDLLARWDHERGSTSVIDRERVLVDQVRVLLELIGTLAVAEEALTAADIEGLAVQLTRSERELREAAGRIEAGTATLHALSALARSWEDEAGRCGSPAAAETLRLRARQPGPGRPGSADARRRMPMPARGPPVLMAAFTREAVARKAYDCATCIGKIRPGQRYKRTAIPPGGEIGNTGWWTIITHLTPGECWDEDRMLQPGEENPPDTEWDPGPEVDGQGGMSKHRHLIESAERSW